jgi:transposase
VSIARSTCPFRLYAGIDIAAETFTAAWMAADPHATPGRTATFDQTPQGFARVQERLCSSGQQPADILVVMEATGSYWIALATTLAQAGFAVSVVNPAQAHHFAKALLRHAKTDAIDARTLAQLAALLRPAPWTPPPPIYAELQQRLAQRDTLIGLRQQVRNQRHALLHLPVVITSVRARLEALLATLDEQIAAVEREIAEAIHLDEEWAATATLLLSITGIGLVTAAWLVVTTLNFTVCATAEQAAAYAGLAPHPCESGTSVRGRAAISGGNKRLRTALYMATLSAGQHNPPIRDFYRRLRAAGKPKKVARCAAARKLLHLAWAVVRKEQAFDPLYGQRRQGDGQRRQGATRVEQDTRQTVGEDGPFPGHGLYLRA